MNSRLWAALAALSLAACSSQPRVGSVVPQATPARVSGIVLKNMDPDVRAQDDLYRHVNGHWLDTTAIPPDKAQYGAGVQVVDTTLERLRGIVDGLNDARPNAADANARLIGDLYGSFMDEARLEALGLKPLGAEFARVDAMRGKGEISGLIAHFQKIGVSMPYDLAVHQDAKDSTKYIVDLYQGGLGLPDRDYYLKDDDTLLSAVRSRYRAHMEKMLGMVGDRQAAATAGEILQLETALARVQWTKVENRDPVKTYNPRTFSQLAALAPGFDWKRYRAEAGLDGRADGVIVSQPTYLAALEKVIEAHRLQGWKSYLKWRVLQSFAPYLSKGYVDEGFDFSGTVVRGIPQNHPRWKRGLAVIERTANEALGKLYVAKYFPPDRKERMDRLVKNLLAAYRQSIETLDWMSPETKKEAQAKLATFMPKIGYPRKWQDYSALVVDRNDLVGNVMRGQAFEYNRNLAKLGKPIDRDEWMMSPQTVNAYYNPELNEIVFPAAILQPPFFDANADDAVNYGAIGAIIGHEISHGFDDQGSQYDGLGNLRDWWTKEDHEKFAAKTRVLIAQYSAYSAVPGYPLNGELTLGENIADNSGLAIAYKAYEISLAGGQAPVIDGFTGEQRFFMGYAQSWQEKTREAEEIRLLKSDPHAPSRFRANGAAVNQPGFYGAFGVKEGDGMYLAPEKRVVIW